MTMELGYSESVSRATADNCLGGTGELYSLHCPRTAVLVEAHTVNRVDRTGQRFDTWRVRP